MNTPFFNSRIAFRIIFLLIGSIVGWKDAQPLHAQDSISQVATPVILPVCEATDIHLDPVLVTISTATDGAIIRYTTNGNDPTEISDRYIGQPLIITESTTVKAKAFKDDLIPSDVASQFYAFPHEYTTLASFKSAADTTEIAKITDNMVVTQPYGKYLYLNSSDRGLLVYDVFDTLTYSFNEGDTVTNIQGRYAVVNGQPMLLLMHDFAPGGNGGLVNPITVTISDVNDNYDDNDAKLLLHKRVRFSQDMTWESSMADSVLTISQGNDNNQKIRLRNRFEGLTCTVSQGAFYDVVGVIGMEDDTVTFLYPRRNDDIRMYHRLNLHAETNGVLLPSSDADSIAAYLSTVELLVIPDNGYHISSIYYYTTNPNIRIDLDPILPNFVMPDEEVTVVAEFAENELYTVDFDPGTGICATSSLTESEWHSGVLMPIASPLDNCVEGGYTFQGWAESFVEETMARPVLYEPGDVYYPTQNTTLYAVYAIQGDTWTEITNAADLIEGDYIIATKSGRYNYYVPCSGAGMNPNIPRMTVNAEGEPITFPGNTPLAPQHLWTISKINDTQYSISYERDGVTYYLKAYRDSNDGVQITTYEPTTGWIFVQDATKGLLLCFLNPEGDPTKTVRYLDKGNEHWQTHSLQVYSGQVHLHLSPCNSYFTAPVCHWAVNATPNPSAAGTVTGMGSFLPGSTVTLTATANDDYVFNSWTVGNEMVSTDNPYTFTITDAISLTANFDLQQTSSLSEGWNWWSTYIEMNGNNGLQQLEESLGHNGLMIKTQTPYVQNYYPSLGYDYWFGSLTNVGLTNETSYLISVANDCEASVMGSTALASDHPMSILPGWNWIGYPMATQLPLSTALNGYTPSANDLIKGQVSSATYYDSYGWFPTSFTLTPGQGYMYYSNATSNQTLTYTSSRGAYVPEPEAEREWSNDVHVYAHNLTVLAVVSIDGVEQRTENLELGAFVNGECRGSAVLSYFEPTGRWYAMLTVSGKDGETLELAALERNSGEVVTKGATTMTFTADAIVGSLDRPYEARFTSAGTLQLYPNPTSKSMAFTFDLPKGETPTEVTVYNALGETVLHETSIVTSTTIRSPKVSGVYMVKVLCKSGAVYTGRLVVK